MDAALKNDVANTIKTVLETFTVQYTKAYVLAMVRMIKLEAQKAPEPWLLQTRPVRAISYLYKPSLAYAYFFIGMGREFEGRILG